MLRGEAQTHSRAVLGVSTVPSPVALADFSSPLAAVLAPATLLAHEKCRASIT